PNPVNSNLPTWIKSFENKTIITACRLIELKNIPMLIEAFEDLRKVLPGYKLKVFGEGPLKNELIESVRSLGLSEEITFPGFTTSIYNEMSKASLFVISSNYEGTSNSMLEAMAIGVPVISTDSPIGGARMFI